MKMVKKQNKFAGMVCLAVLVFSLVGSIPLPVQATCSSTSSYISFTALPFSPFPNCIAVDSGGIVYVGLNNYLKKSTDGGSSFSTVYTFTDFIQGLYCVDTYVYASTCASDAVNGTLWLSANGGTSFSSILTLNVGKYCRYDWDIAYDSQNNYLYIGEYGLKSAYSYVWRSHDLGTTWTKVLDVYNYATPNTTHVHLVRVDPYTNHVWVTAGDTVGLTLESSDYGATWVQRTNATYNQDGNNGQAAALGMSFYEDRIYLLDENWDLRCYNKSDNTARGCLGFRGYGYPWGMTDVNGLHYVVTYNTSLPSGTLTGILVSDNWIDWVPIIGDSQAGYIHIASDSTSIFVADHDGYLLVFPALTQSQFDSLRYASLGAEGAELSTSSLGWSQRKVILDAGTSVSLRDSLYALQGSSFEPTYYYNQTNNKIATSFYIDNQLEETNPLVLSDDGQTSFWTATSWGTGSLVYNGLSNDATFKKKGTDSLKLLLGTGGTKLAVAIQHNYSTSEDWSLYDFFSFWLYGMNDNGKLWVQIQTPNATNYLDYIFKDTWSGWRRLVIPFASFAVTGSKDMTKIKYIKIAFYTAGTRWIDRVVSDKPNPATIELFLPNTTTNVQVYSFDSEHATTDLCWKQIADYSTSTFTATNFYVLGFYEYYNHLMGTASTGEVYASKGASIYNIGDFGSTVTVKFGDSGSNKIVSSTYGALKRVLITLQVPPNDFWGRQDKGVSQMRLAIVITTTNWATTIQREASSSPYITETSYISSITAESYSNNLLSFTVSSPSGATSITKVYCGSMGQPVAITPLLADGGYDAGTGIQTLVWTHSSQQEFTLDWTPTGGGGGGGGGTALYRLAVKVMRGSVPVPQTSVSVNSETSTTDSEGVASFNLRAGVYTVTANFGDETQTKQVDLRSDAEVTFTLASGWSFLPSMDDGTMRTIVFVGVILLVMLFLIRKKKIR